MTISEKNFQICRKCQTRKLRIKVGRYPGKDPKYVDELSHPWNGKTCSKCYRNIQKQRMADKRNAP